MNIKFGTQSQPAFKRLDHLLCDVPDIDEALNLFHSRLGFPVAWPIGRYWPHGRTCGIALGGVNLEFIQEDDRAPSEATIKAVAFEPTSHVHEAFAGQDIPFTTFDKWEDDQELLRLRGMTLGQGKQLLCVNTIPEEDKLQFPFFACAYEDSVRNRLSPTSLQRPNGNCLTQIVFGHPNPIDLKTQIEALGIVGGVPLAVEQHPTKEVLRLQMKNGPIDLGPWPARFRIA